MPLNSSSGKYSITIPPCLSAACLFYGAICEGEQLTGNNSDIYRNRYGGMYTLVCGMRPTKCPVVAGKLHNKLTTSTTVIRCLGLHESQPPNQACNCDVCLIRVRLRLLRSIARYHPLPGVNHFLLKPSVSTGSRGLSSTTLSYSIVGGHSSIVIMIADGGKEVVVYLVAPAFESIVQQQNIIHVLSPPKVTNTLALKGGAKHFLAQERESHHNYSVYTVIRNSTVERPGSFHCEYW